MHNQSLLNEYFSTKWKPNSNIHTYSGPSVIAQKIASHEQVLDIGCGQNPFRALLPNVVGIDPAFEQADVHCTIEQFETDQLFDVATCLGSINFGSRDTIELQVAKVVSLLKPCARIYWRLNPGRQDHADSACQQIPFFPWTLEYLNKLADKHGFRQENAQVESGASLGKSVVRLYAEWHR
ncbi:class I SAM-dependent methyltransferase [Haliscomenobacter sp.]|uniref:class I SAM-dependent methyltransferase n=1 Tax=Haliscomenobacter sp. TaxID=2717303 RepID=UPI003364E8F0